MMTEFKMKSMLYEFYKLDWMLSHGYTILDMMVSINEYFAEDNYEVEDLPSKEEMLTEWEIESGFDGEIYVFFPEFCVCELKDRNYIYDLLEKIGDISLRTELRKAYTEYVKV